MFHTTLTAFGNTSKNRADILILLLHAGDEQAYLDQAHSEVPHIDKNILEAYMLHEADRGTREVGHLTAEFLVHHDPNMRCDVLEILAPRSFLDPNRPKHLSTPEFLPVTYWQSLYDEILESIMTSCDRADYILQLHSMCGYDPVFPSLHKQKDITNEALQHFLDHCYSGRERHWDVVDSTTDGVMHAYEPWIESSQRVFGHAHIPLKNNHTYQLIDDYPGTIIMKAHRSILIEIPKTWIATDDTREMIDTSKVILDPKKLTQAAELLALSFLEMHTK